jgi:hypothetical protein
LTADEAVIADAADAQLAGNGGEDGGEGQPALSDEAQSAPSGEGQQAPSDEDQQAPSDEDQPAPSEAKHPHGPGESPPSETPPTATDVDPSSDTGEQEETGVLAADEPA